MIDIRLDETMMENIYEAKKKKKGEIWDKSKTGVKQVAGAALEELKGAFRCRERKSACEKGKFLGRVYSRRRESLRVLDYAELSRKTKSQRKALELICYL